MTMDNVLIITSSFAIGAVDSWFAAVTSAVNIALVVPSTNITASFARSIDPALCGSETWYTRACPSRAQASCSYPCSITNWTTAGNEREGLYNAQQAAETLMYNSKTDTIYNMTVNGSNYFFLGDIKSGAELDFVAETLAIKTECQMRTPDCSVDSDGGFTCGSYSSPSFSYSGEVGVDPTDAMMSPEMASVGIQFFNDTQLSEPVGKGSAPGALFSTQNPMQFLAWSKGFPPVDTYSDEFGYMRGNGFLKEDIDGDAVFILSCSSTISHAEYYWVNGTVSLKDGLEAYENAGGYIGAVYSAPFAIDSALSHLALQDAAALSAYQTRPERLARVFGDYFSRAAVAFSSGFSIPLQNDKEWTRDNNYLATRVPLVPLYTLVALKAVYALFALCLALLAVFLTNPNESQEVKERLTVDGLAAGFFEPNANHAKAVKNVQDLFGEHHGTEKSEETKKIGLLQTEQGGWLWVARAQKAATGLGLQEVLNTVADEAATAAMQHGGDVGNLAEGYQLVKQDF